MNVESMADHETFKAHLMPANASGIDLHQHNLSSKDALALAQGFGEGFVDTVGGFIEFLATPEAVNKSLIQTGEQVGCAYDYYTGKFSNGNLAQIGQDANTAIKAASDSLRSLDMEGRGRLLGSVGAQLALAEAGATVSRALLARSKAALNQTQFLSKDMSHFGHAGEPEELTPGVQKCEVHLNRSLKVGELYDVSTSFSRTVQDAVNQLPEKVCQMLVDNGIKITVVPEIRSVKLASSLNTRGLYDSQQRTIFICERFQRKGEWISELADIDRILKHEIGHVIDKLDKSGVHLTDGPNYVAAYGADIGSMTSARRHALDYYATGKVGGRREVFAEAYAIAHSNPTAIDAKWRSTFVQAFPNMMRLVEKRDII